MDPPSNIGTDCPDCGEETIHQVLKGTLGKGKGSVLVLDATVKCNQCGRVHHVHIRRDRPKEVPVVLSDGKTSERLRIEIPKELILTVKDEIEIDGTMVQVTSIEVGGKRMDKAKAEDISTLWTKKFDKIIVKVSVYKGRRTSSETLMAAPGEEFSIGDMLEFKGRYAVIVNIKVPGKTIRRGSAEARDITRIYAKEVR